MDKCLHCSEPCAVGHRGVPTKLCVTHLQRHRIHCKESVRKRKTKIRNLEQAYAELQERYNQLEARINLMQISQKPEEQHHENETTSF